MLPMACDEQDKEDCLSVQIRQMEKERLALKADEVERRADLRRCWFYFICFLLLMAFMIFVTVAPWIRPDDSKQAVIHTTTHYWATKNGGGTGSSQEIATFDISEGPTWSFKDESESLVRATSLIDSERNIYLTHVEGAIRKYRYGSAPELMWIYRHSAQIPAVPALLGNRLFAIGTDGVVFALALTSGQLLWQKQAGNSTAMDAASLTVHEDIVLAAVRQPETTLEMNNCIVALSAEDGAILWHHAPDGPVYNWIGSIVSDSFGPSLIYSDTTGSAYRVLLSGGRVLWKSSGGGLGEFSSGGAAAGFKNLVFISSNLLYHGAQGRPHRYDRYRGQRTGMLQARQISNGELVWRQFLHWKVSSPPSLGRLKPVMATCRSKACSRGNASSSSDLAVIVATEKDLESFDAESGEKLEWEWAPPIWQPALPNRGKGDYAPDHLCRSDPFSSVTIDGNGTCYVGHISGHLYALQDKNGDGILTAEHGEISLFDGGRCYQGSPSVAPGMLVATPCDGVHVFIRDSSVDRKVVS